MPNGHKIYWFQSEFVFVCLYCVLVVLAVLGWELRDRAFAPATHIEGGGRERGTERKKKEK